MEISILGANSYIARNMISVLGRRIEGGENFQLYLYDFQEGQLDGREGYEQIDVLDKESVKKINYGADILYMFIGKTGTGIGFHDYETFVHINEVALLNILAEYVGRGSHAKIVFPSTRLVYKGRQGLLDEGSEKRPLTVYAANKLACEQYLAMYQRVFGVSYAVLRICVPYGTMVPDAHSYGTAEFMLEKALGGKDITLYGDGGLRRTIVHIEDLCEVLLRSGLSASCLNDAYNVGGEDYSLLEMAERIATKYGVGVIHGEWPEQALKIESGDTVFNSDKLDSIIQYSHRHTFEGWVGESNGGGVRGHGEKSGL